MVAEARQPVGPRVPQKVVAVRDGETAPPRRQSGQGLAAACAREAGRGRWLEYDPARDWLPEPPVQVNVPPREP
ncbi:hypothetical protein SAMN06297387_11620 [Streptomyces zhaozhouensis]|uniref:Uncharacterized protein n=1 Tax=Streptomyces zhaozhouensis TaxID=1300267 RepID=A0A286E061_9ACTN|nr:hypothetical protein SAMN06297387_11620 [Streptomyces zhaozhouensis]